jgi:hypothetical protein
MMKPHVANIAGHIVWLMNCLEFRPSGFEILARSKHTHVEKAFVHQPSLFVSNG